MLHLNLSCLDSCEDGKETPPLEHFHFVVYIPYCAAGLNSLYKDVVQLFLWGRTWGQISQPISPGTSFPILASHFVLNSIVYNHKRLLFIQIFFRIQCVSSFSEVAGTQHSIVKDFPRLPPPSFSQFLWQHFALMAPPGLLLSSQLFLLIIIVAYCHQHHSDCQSHSDP